MEISAHENVKTNVCACMQVGIQFRARIGMSKCVYQCTRPGISENIHIGDNTNHYVVCWLLFLSLSGSLSSLSPSSACSSPQRWESACAGVNSVGNLSVKNVVIFVK